MNNAQQIANVLYNALGLVALWYLARCWRDYKIAKFREDMFGLRNCLFRYASSGAVSFDNPAYRKVRLLLNSMIRFAHGVSFVRLVVILAAEKLHPRAYQLPSFTDELQPMQEQLSPEAYQELLSINRQVLRLTMLQILTTSFVALPMLSLYIVYSVFKLGLPKLAAMKFANKGQAVLYRSVNRHLRLIEQQAVETRQIELDRQRCPMAV